MAVTSLTLSRARTSRRILLDRISRRLVVSGGLVIIASILAILFVIAAEVVPLFKPPAATLVARRAAPGADAAGRPAPGEAAGVDEYREIAYRITAGGRLEFTPLKDDRPLPPVPVPGLDGAQVTAVAAVGKSRHVLGTSDGRLIPLEMTFDVTFTAGRRTVVPAPAFGAPTLLDG
ncbi:MAG: hypothetical protein HYV94_19965, partial [Candidatus Rokubacteria bacterium]|nr:hypothetical protein [Candidatus Rokubacteria bacterium]